MSYGAGGALILSIAIGSLLVIARWKTNTPTATLIYATSVCAAFYALGFRIISEPVNTQTLMIFLAMIGIPTFIAILVSSIRASSSKKNCEQDAPSNGGQRPSLISGFPPRRG
jgi:hypothetical protein